MDVSNGLKYFYIPQELFLSLSCGLQEPSSPSSSLPSVAILTQAFIALGFVERSIAFSRSCPRHLWTITFASLHLAMPLPCAHAPRGHAKLWKLVKSLQAGKRTLHDLMYDTHAGFLANLLKAADTFALQRSSCTAYASTVRGCPTCYWFFPWSFDTLGHNCTNYYNLI